MVRKDKARGVMKTRGAVFSIYFRVFRSLAFLMVRDIGLAALNTFEDLVQVLLVKN